MWLGIFSALSVSICILCTLAAIYVAQRAIHERESVVRRLRSAELLLQSLQTSLESVSVELEALANRVKMQRVRNATTHATGASNSPDPYQDPDAWRQAMNRKLAMTKIPQ